MEKRDIVSNCKSTCGTLSCLLAVNHEGHHEGAPGISWEDTKRTPVKVEHFIIEGRNSKSCHLWTEFTTLDGRKFGYRNYQIFELDPQKQEAYTSPFTGSQQ